MKKALRTLIGLYLNTLAVLAPARAARKGFELFCRPMRTPVTPKQLSFFDTAQKFKIHLDGVTAQGYRWGNGPRRVLFLHGWQSHTYRWKPYIEALPKDKFTVYSIDAPGHGLSSGNFLSVPLYSKLIQTFIQQHNGLHAVVGHSLGGFSLLHALYEAPTLQVHRIILLAPPGEATEFISVFQKTLKLSARTVGLVIEHFRRQYNVGPDFFSAKRFAEGLSVKGLIIHDQDDVEAPYHYASSLQEAWKTARLITVRGYGHNLKSATVVTEVVNFIEEALYEVEAGR